MHPGVQFTRSSQESVGATCPIIPLAKPFPGRFYPTETVPQFQLIQPFPSCPWAEGPSRLRNTHYGGDVQILTTASKSLARPLNSRTQPTDSCEDPIYCKLHSELKSRMPLIDNLIVGCMEVRAGTGAPQRITRW